MNFLKQNPTATIIGIVALVILLAFGWWFFSPAFIDQTVNEPDPFADAEVAAVQPTDAPTPLPTATPVPTETPEPTATAETIAVVESAEEDSEETEPTLAPTATPQPTATLEPTAEPTAEPMTASSSGVNTLASGTFVGAGAGYRGAGNATILERDGQRVLRFTDFEVTNGPDLRVYLVRNADGRDEATFGGHIELGELKGNQGDQNYEIPADIDLSEYGGIVIYCQPFHVTFAVADFGG